MLNQREKGLTLTELMVAVAIVILFSSVAFISIDIARNKTRDAVIITELEQLQGIAETVYHPQIGYKELWEMRQGTNPLREDHPNIAAIRKRISDMGRSFNLRFPQDSGDPSISGYHEYCAYVFTFSDKNTIFCVDSHGVADKIDVSGNNKVNCQILDYTIHNCEYY